MPPDLRVHKVPTTPDDQSRAIVGRPGHLGIDDRRRGARHDRRHQRLARTPGRSTALLDHAGFADVLVIGRQNRPHLYHLSQARPARWSRMLAAGGPRTGRCDGPMFDRWTRRRGGVGRTISPRVTWKAWPSSSSSPSATRRMSRPPPNIIGCGLPRPADLVEQRRSCPNTAKYERTATTVINAYVQPLVARYLHRLDAALHESHVRIMQSNGGAIGLAQAAAQAGARGAERAGRRRRRRLCRGATGTGQRRAAA